MLHLDLKPDNILLTHIGNHVKLVDLGYCYQDSYPFTTGGTPEYAAPEGKKTPASDIYSLGRIFTELGITSEKVTAKCHSINPDERYQSVEELTAAMRQKHFPWKVVTSILFVLLLIVGIWWWTGRKTPMATEPATVTVHHESSENAVLDESSDNAVLDELSDNAIQDKPSESIAQNELIEKVESSDITSSVKMPTASESSSAASERQETTSYDETGKEYVARILKEPGDMLTRNQKKTLSPFVSVTDSILAELKQFVANERLPYQLGGLDAYKTAYESLKAATLKTGTRGQDVPYWVRTIWMKYDGKPKPYNMFAHYLYLELASIEAIYQKHATNYNLSQKQKNENSPQP